MLRGGRKRFGLNVNAEKTINRTVGICQTCGYSWHIDPAAPPAQESPVQEATAEEPQFEDNNVPETEEEMEPDDGTPSPTEEETEPDDETPSPQNNYGTDPEDKKRAWRVALIVVIIIILLIILAAIITRRHNHNLQEEEPKTEEAIDNAQVVEEEEEKEEEEGTRKEQRKERREERRAERRKEKEAEETTNDESQDEQEAEQEAVVEEVNPLDVFRYEIVDGFIALESYSGEDNTVEIFPSYTVEGVEYVTDLSDFSAKKIENLILDEGITELNLSMFYECENSIKKIYFPKSLSIVYDYTLADLCEDNENIYEIYYAGSEEEWNSIFTEYDPDWRNEEDPYNKGAALGARINIIVGQAYDASHFAYFYNQSVDNFLLTITD